MSAILPVTTYNNTKTCDCYYQKAYSYKIPSKIVAIVLPQSDKPLTKKTLNQKISRLQSHVDLLADQLERMTMSRNTHGGKNFRGKKIVIQNQHESALCRLDFLKEAQNTFFPRKQRKENLSNMERRLWSISVSVVE